MKFEIKEKLRKRVDEIESNYLSESELKQTFLEVVTELLSVENYQIVPKIKQPLIRPFVSSLKSPDEKIGIYVDSGSLNVNLTGLNRYLQFGQLKGFDRNIIFLRSRFPDEKVAKTIELSPIVIEIVDPFRLRAWIDELKTEIDEINSYEVLFKAFNEQLVKIILENPTEIRKIEWREFERLMADLLAEIGFEVELTPPSKDGGKDIILRCSKYQKSYIVEIKHWASGQKVGKKFLTQFLNVIINEERERGLFISTFGYTKNAFEGITRIQRERIRVAEKEKVLALCEIYKKKRSGLLIPMKPIEEILFEDTK